MNKLPLFPLFEDEDDEQAALDAALLDAERQALAAVQQIATLIEQNPDKALIGVSALRKVSTIAGAKAQSIGLKGQPRR